MSKIFNAPISGEEFVKQKEKWQKQYQVEESIKPVYFNISSIIDLQKYIIYIISTKKGTGKSYSTQELARQIYKATGMYTTWIRREKSEMLLWAESLNWDKEEGWDINDNGIYETLCHCGCEEPKKCDKRYKQYVIKFVWISRLRKFSSIANSIKCVLIVFDEILSLDGKYTKDEFEMVNVFIASTERKGRTPIIMLMNKVSYDNPYFRPFGITPSLKMDESGVIKKIDLENQLLYIDLTYSPLFSSQTDFKKSTSYSWSAFSSKARKFIYDNESLIKNGEDLVIPISDLAQMQATINFDLKYRFAIDMEVYFFYKGSDGNIYFTDEPITPEDLEKGNVLVFQTKSQTLKINKKIPISEPESYLEVWFNYFQKNKVFFGDFRTKDSVQNFTYKILGTRIK